MLYLKSRLVYPTSCNYSSGRSKWLSYNSSTGEFTFTPVNLSTYATQTYVDTEIANLVDSAPTSLDTLNELAAALNDDANFATTVTNSLATKAPLADPALTGTPTAPTASSGTNTTQIATTAFVQTAVANDIELTDLSVALQQHLQVALLAITMLLDNLLYSCGFV